MERMIGWKDSCRTELTLWGRLLRGSGCKAEGNMPADIRVAVMSPPKLGCSDQPSSRHPFRRWLGPTARAMRTSTIRLILFPRFSTRHFKWNVYYLKSLIKLYTYSPRFISPRTWCFTRQNGLISCLNDVSFAYKRSNQKTNVIGCKVFF